MPLFSLFFFILCLGNCGTPLTLNFIGEFMSLYGVFERLPIMGLLASSSIVFSAAYTIYLYNRIAFGGVASAFFKISLPDLTKREFMLLLSLILFTVILGIYPSIVLDGIHYNVSSLIKMLFNLLIFNILSNAVTQLDNRTFYYSRNISIGLIYSILLCSISIINTEISIFNGLLHIDNLIQIFTIFILLSSLIILNLTNFYPFNNNNKINKLFNIFKISEYSIIILFINIGAILLISSLDMVTIFLALELQSYGLYILCTLNRNSESSTSAGLKYFLLGSLASCLILLGLAFIYANEGNTNLENLQIISSISYNSNYYNIMMILNSIEISLIILSIGFLFKIAAAPIKWFREPLPWVRLSNSGELLKLIIPSNY